MRVRAAPLPGDRVDRLDELRAHLEEPLVGEGDDVALADTRLEELVDVLVHPVDHRTGLGQQHDLVRALDLPGEHHQLLAVLDVDAGGLEGEEHRGLGHVDTEGHVADTLFLEDRGDLLGCSLLEASRRGDRPLETGVAADGVLRVHPRLLEPVRLGGRAEVPDSGLPGTGHQGIPFTLVERPVPDVGAGEVADVARLEEQHRTEIGLLQLLAHPGYPMVAQPFPVDALLPIDAHHAGGRACSYREFRHRPVLSPPASAARGEDAGPQSASPGPRVDSASGLPAGRSVFDCSHPREGRSPRLNGVVGG